MTIKAGVLLWPQTASWGPLRDAAIRADRAGLDSLWTWDHLMSIVGPWEGPILEGWTTLAALAPVTDRVTLGLMVGANTFRNPGLTAKLATTLDHVSGGRAVLGIGGAWFEREHDAFGFDATWGSGFGERLDRLDESVMLLRRLLDGERIAAHDGRFYTMRDALVEPRPIQARLPILIGGSGPKKTLRTTARYADAWNTSGELGEVRDKLAILDEHCAAVGRDRREIELTISFPIVIRDEGAAAEAAATERFRFNGVENAGGGPHLAGPPDLIAAALAPYRDLGFSTVIVRLPAPYDRETIARMAEVGALLDG
jgi:alkanesulfonate monooxygenase SsuD/methylene tetrahydromethanopterin reductase-like flavin-dependent oxidoreductase (luciferase family)